MKLLARTNGNLGCRFVFDLSRSTGFTTVELIVVLIIVGVLASFVAPKMMGSSSFDEFGFRSELRSAIAFAQKSAIASRRYVCVDIAASAATFTLLTTEPESVTTVACNHNLALPKGRSSCSGNPAHQICPPSGVSAGSASWVFDPLGRPVTTGKVVLTSSLSISVTNQTAITVEAETGYVH